MIKTTRLKTVQVPMNRTYDLSNQCDGVTQVFHLPVRVEKLDSHYVIFNGQIYKNDRNHTFYKISADGTTLTTFFDYPPTPGKNRALQFVKTEASEGQAAFATEEFVQNEIAVEASERENADTALGERIGTVSMAVAEEANAREAAVEAEAQAREAADNDLLDKINTIEASSDVKDVVGTKAELDAYDKSTLGDNDIVKVLHDESDDDKTNYYRFIKADDNFTLIGSEGPYYTQAEVEGKLLLKSDKADTYTKEEVDALVGSSKVFIAEYNVTTAQEILEYMSLANEPFAPIVVKRGSEYYTVILAMQQGLDKVYLRVVGTISGKYNFFNYVVDGSTWTLSMVALQNQLTAGENITIENDVISATGSEGKTYTGGNGITVDNTNNTISANGGIVEFVGKINYYTAGDGQTSNYSGFQFDSSWDTGDNMMYIEFPNDGVKFIDSVSGLEYLLHPTETINDTDWSALWQ